MQPEVLLGTDEDGVICIALSAKYFSDFMSEVIYLL